MYGSNEKKLCGGRSRCCGGTGRTPVAGPKGSPRVGEPSMKRIIACPRKPPLRATSSSRNRSGQKTMYVHSQPWTVNLAPFSPLANISPDSTSLTHPIPSESSFQSFFAAMRLKRQTVQGANRSRHNAHKNLGVASQVKTVASRLRKNTSERQDSVLPIPGL